MDTYTKRQYLLIGIFCLASLVMIIRLFYIQVIDSSYKFLPRATFCADKLITQPEGWCMTETTS